MNPSTWQAYWMIRRNRTLKKRAVKKQLAQMSLDKTTTIYSLILVVYLFASIFIFNDYLEVFHGEFLFIEQQLAERFWLLLTIVPLRFVFQSFRNPGILISSSEYQLGMLPHSIKKIAFYVVVEKLIKQLLIYIVVGLIITVITPIDPLLVWTYLGMFWILELLMIIPTWKLFQARFIVRFTILIVLIIINGIGMLTQQTKIVSIVIIAAMLIANWKLYKKMFVQINWGRVTEVNDFLVWNMQLVSMATKTKFKRQRKYSIFQNNASRKKPFVYADGPIYKRLWIQHFRENIEFILHVSGGLLVAVIVFAYVNEVAGLIGIALSIYVYTTFAKSMFANRFHSGIVQVLPWNVTGFRKTMKIWVIIGFLPVMIPIIVVSVLHFGWWSISFLLLVISLFLLNYEFKIDNAVDNLDKRLDPAWKSVLPFFSLGFILLCKIQPYFSLVSIVILVYLFIRGWVKSILTHVKSEQ